MRPIFAIVFFTLYLSVFSQQIWKSSRYHYTIEIPIGFLIVKGTGLNVDFKAGNRNSAIVLVIKTLPPELIREFSGKTIFDMLGDLKSFESEWANGAQEHLSSPKLVKSGKTTVANVPTYWMDFTTFDPVNKSTLYNKNYQFKINAILYTITLTCDQSSLSTYQPVWLRFINSFKP